MKLRRFIAPGARALSGLLSFGAKSGPHVTRYTMYKKIVEQCGLVDEGQSALSISGSAALCHALGFKDENILDTEFPDVSLLSLPYDNNHFDAIVCDQILEHVRGDPQVAMRESFRVVRDGGLVIHTTCQIMPLHMVPDDYWRFTPFGLELLVSAHGRVMEAAGWGHPAIMLLDALGLRHLPVPERKWHPVNLIARANRPSWPVVTWVVARKQDAL